MTWRENPSRRRLLLVLDSGQVSNPRTARSRVSIPIPLSHLFRCCVAGVSLATIIFATNPIAYVSSIIGLGVGPYAAMQQSKITQVEALRQTNKRMAEEVDQLKEENERLQGQIGSLEESVKK